MKKIKLVEVRGKRGRKVPILLIKRNGEKYYVVNGIEE